MGLRAGTGTMELFPLPYGKDRRGWTAEGVGQRKEGRSGKGGGTKQREGEGEEKSRPHGHF